MTGKNWNTAAGEARLARDSLNGTEAEGTESDCSMSDDSEYLHQQEQEDPAAGKHRQEQQAQAVVNLDDLDSEQQFIDKMYGCSPDHWNDVKQHDPDALFALRHFRGLPRWALGGFLKAMKRSTWMRQQHDYAEMAALAAAYEIRGEASGLDAMKFLQCGKRVTRRDGRRYIAHCDQVSMCKRCNLHQRLNPAKDEFLRRFHKARYWFGITVVAVSDPARAGVKIRRGYDNQGQPIDEYVYKPDDPESVAVIPRHGLDAPEPAMAVFDGAMRFCHWLTNNGYFGGLHAIPDMKITFYPDDHAESGIGHTANAHVHAYGNTSQLVDQDFGESMWKGALTCLIKGGCGELHGYPLILLIPAPTVEALETAMNYIIKPFKLVQMYREGLEKGCPVRGLNYEFHGLAWDIERLLPGSWIEERYGNMNTRARHRYIGIPQLTAAQVRIIRQKIRDDEAEGWEIERYFLFIRSRVEARRKHAARELAQIPKLLA